MNLEGRRGPEQQVWVVPQGLWGILIHAHLSPDLEIAYSQGRELFKAGKFVEAAQRWRSAAAQVRVSGPPWLRLGCSEK